MEREAEAIEYFQKALKVDKNQEELWNYLGYIQFSIGQNYEAIESFNEAIKLNNEFEEALKICENFQFSRSKNEVFACSDFGACKTEGFAEAYMNLGNVYKELGKDKLALDCFQKVRDISPDNGEVLREIEELKAK